MEDRDLIKAFEDARFKVGQKQVKEKLKSLSDENGLIKINKCAYHFHLKI